MKRIWLCKLSALFLVIAFGIVPCWSQQTAPASGVDPKADKLLRAMSDLMANAKNVSFRTTEIHDRIRASGKKVQVKVAREGIVRRPDSVWIHAITHAPDRDRELSLWYDGKTLTYQSDKEKVYARTKVPPTIDETLDYIGDRLDTPTPMADLLYSSPYDSYVAAEGTTGQYVKTEKINNQSCAQLAFQNPVVDFRLWVNEGKQPELCQLEITYKFDEGKPKVVITFLEWNFAPQIAENTFIHTPPADYKKIKIIGSVELVQQPKEQQPQTQTQEQNR